MLILDLRHNCRAISAGVRWTVVCAGVVLLVVISVRVEAGTALQSTVGAASGTDARWQPWLGCWELSNDAVQDPGEATPDQPLASANVPGAASGIRVCVIPASAASGVRMTTQVQGRPVLEEMLVADGTEQPIEDKTCRGSPAVRVVARRAAIVQPRRDHVRRRTAALAVAPRHDRRRDVD